MVVVVVCGHQALGRGCAGPVSTPVSTSCSPNTATAASTSNHPAASPISLLRIFITYRGRLALVVTGMLLQDIQGFGLRAGFTAHTGAGACLVSILST